RADSVDWPGFIRPIIITHQSLLSVSREDLNLGAAMGCMLKGRKMSGELWTPKAPVKPGGFIPIMVIGVELTRIFFADNIRRTAKPSRPIGIADDYYWATANRGIIGIYNGAPQHRANVHAAVVIA